MQVDDDEKRRSAGRMQVADQPAPVDVAHDVLDRTESKIAVGLVMHGQENTGDNLDYQHQQRQRTEEVPEVEVFRRVILGQMLFEHLRQRKTRIDPAEQSVTVIIVFTHYATPSSPITITLSLT